MLSLADIGCEVDIPETGSTLVDNAVLKAQYVSDNYGYDSFADDTGLIVPELNGEPGVYSARYAGEQKNSEDNIDKLLENLAHSHNREAYFETSIALIIGGQIETFAGICEGRISMKRIGTNGFGYDSIFIPSGSERSFAEMSAAEKNTISHRKIAIEKLLTFLKNQMIDSQ